MPLALPIELEDISVFDACPREERVRIARAVASALGADFSPAAELVGSRGLCGLVHARTKMIFVAVPGGHFDMGLTEEDVESASEYVDFTRGVAQWIDALAERARPVRRVLVKPFVCAIELLSDEAISILSEGKITYRSFEAYEAKKAGDFVASLSAYRLVSEAELEWLGREGGATHFVNDCGRAVSEGEEFPEVNAFGVRDLAYGEFAADAWHPSYAGAPETSIAWEATNVPGVRRGGLPFGVDETSDELLFGLAAYRAPVSTSEEPMHLRLVCR